MERTVTILQGDVDQALRDPLIQAQIRINALVRELKAADERWAAPQVCASCAGKLDRPEGEENV